jgi:protein-disulfide isomerase
VALAALAGIAIVAVGGGGIKTMSQRWEAVAARYDAEKLRIVGAMNAPSLTDQASQAMPADPGQPTEPYPQPADGGDHPTGTGS